MASPEALAAKNTGNKFFAAKEYEQAIEWYTKAIGLYADDHAFYSNRSAAYIALDNFDAALEDGRKCIELNPKWIKGYYRAAVGLSGLHRYEECMDLLNKALRIGTDNDLKRIHAEATAAVKLLDNVKDANGNKLSRAAAAKQLGTDAYRVSNYEEAIKMFTRAIVNAKNDEQELIAACYSNRAACHMQHHGYKKVIADCTECLKIQPENAKALMRRCLAYEALEKYQLALDDAKQCLSLEPGMVLASKAVTRLTMTCRSLY
mmetsp:Transcript_34644/g.87084  ORF Transcript_34644/g.87084 Transcript_34644/m.87084 type:complete len:262 (+) Transcript_34644:112-897(+)|eukprot:CAMPEP_0177634534 /NCGR_PEP_ID=MMETSP0447-20121125/3419_1 /TAXON_ID=0 /ORGANISM="Stygamoeba regulata, Strain BSH-02190019" /LENGTH=261 /DNA_ID=CAMNT_0019136261 /DNA_START=137 /DNA_END=922 /DNA_ORIENTATION=+